MERIGIEYEMTLIDINKSVIKDVSERRKIYLPVTYAQKSPQISNAWDKYLSDTVQPKEVVFDLEEGLNIPPGVFLGYPKKFIDDLMGHGFLRAQVPKSFTEKLSNGQIVLINENIASVSYLGQGNYDFVSALNLLYQLSEREQKFTIFYLASYTAAGGLMLLDDLSKRVPLLPEHNGWFDKQKQLDLGLRIDEILNETRYSKTFTFRKTDE